jgi:F1F0 ATPase subunit 2
MGLIAGIFYFSLLWLTVNSIQRFRNPVLISLIGFLLRIAGVVAVFYLIAVNMDWIGVLIALLGFVIMKITFMRKFRPVRKKVGKV